MRCHETRSRQAAQKTGGGSYPRLAVERRKNRPFGQSVGGRSVSPLVWRKKRHHHHPPPTSFLIYVPVPHHTLASWCWSSSPARRVAAAASAPKAASPGW